MEYIKLRLSKYSRYGLIAASVYVAIVLYYIIQAATCSTNPIDCSRPLFLLSLPAYLLIIPIIGHFNILVYALIVVTTSTIYTAGFYRLGEWIEQLRRKPKEA